jgi:hypothetical protein
VTITLPSPAKAADVLDPESIVEHRANIEWGEVPKRTPEHIGNVNLSSDGKTITYRPGQYPSGVLYVMFDAPVDPVGAKVTMGSRELAFGGAPRGRLWKDGEKQILLEPGTVVIPPPTEANRMGIGAKSEMALLEQLGYVEPSTDGDDEPHSDDEPHADEAPPSVDQEG